MTIPFFINQLAPPIVDGEDYVADIRTINRPEDIVVRVLDDQLKYVSSYPQSGGIVVGSSGLNGTNLQAPLAYTGIPITNNGFLYIWVSNETPSWDVFFDNLKVAHYPGPLLEETHYYPCGLTMAGISSKALKPFYAENKFRYNGNELQNKEFSDGTGLENYDFGARMFDPQIGRWLVLDPLMEGVKNWSAYSFGADNPIKFLDLEGYVIGNPNDPLTKRIQNAWNKTEVGRKIWKALEANKRTFYIEGVRNNSQETWRRNLSRQMTSETEGQTMPKDEFERYKSGDYSDQDSKYTTFNPKTGNYDKTSAWDETYIVINESALDLMAAMKARGDNDPRVLNRLVEAQLVHTSVHEAVHGIQNSFQLGYSKYNSRSHTYSEGPPIPYYDNNGNLARHQGQKADKMGQQAEEQYLEAMGPYPSSSSSSSDSSSSDSQSNSTGSSTDDPVPEPEPIPGPCYDPGDE